MKALVCQTPTHLLEYRLFSAPESNKPRMVLVPGMLSSASYWSEQPEFMQMLSAETSGGLAISLRGRGGSSHEVPAWGPEEHSEDIKAVVDQEKYEKFVLCGHSAGAAYALSYALEHPNKLSGLIIGDYFPCHFPLEQDWLDSVSDLAQKQQVSPQTLKNLAESSQMINYAGRLAELTFPVLVIRGTQEDAVLEKDAVSLYDRTPVLQISEVPSGHDVFACTETTKTVREWLQALPVAS